MGAVRFVKSKAEIQIVRTVCGAEAFVVIVRVSNWSTKSVPTSGVVALLKTVTAVAPLPDFTVHEKG